MSHKLGLKSLNINKKHKNIIVPASFKESDFQQKPQNQTPKQALKDFLNNNEANEPYLITILGNEEAGYEFLHRMRNELSRFRAKLSERGFVTKRFKVLKESITAKPDGICEIIIIQSDKVQVKPDEDLDDVMGALSI